MCVCVYESVCGYVYIYISIYIYACIHAYITYSIHSSLYTERCVYTTPLSLTTEKEGCAEGIYGETRGNVG